MKRGNNQKERRRTVEKKREDEEKGNSGAPKGKCNCIDKSNNKINNINTRGVTRSCNFYVILWGSWQRNQSIKACIG